MKISHLQPFLLAIVLLAACTARAQQNPNGQVQVTMFPRPYLFLIRDPLVHDDLKLNAQQLAAVDALNDQLDTALWSMRNKSPQHINDTVQQATKTAKEKLEFLLKPQQKERLSQIVWRTLGTKAFLADELPEKLSLSEQQTEDIRAKVTETQEAISELDPVDGTEASQKAWQTEARKLKTDEQKYILKTLDDNQHGEWVKLVGKPIEVGKLGFVSFKAPEIAGEGDWINSSPLSNEQLKGKVVALHFYAFGCGNCKANFPWYKGWHQSYANRGLVVLGIHTPETSRERDVANVRRSAADSGLKFPIVVDNDKQNWNAWGNSMWPSTYLIDKQGRVRYWWYGELNWQGNQGEQMLRNRIEELLAEK